MPQHHQRRRERLARALAGQGVDAFLSTGRANVTYLTGFTGDSSAVLVTPSRSLLVSDPRYVGQIQDECPDVEAHIRAPAQKLHEAIVEVLGKLGATSCGCEAGSLTVAEGEALREAGPAVSWKGSLGVVEKLRMVKDEVEVGQIRRAIDIAERAFTAFLALLRADDTEKDLADAMEGMVRRCGGKGCAFEPILAVGERSALPHCPPTGRRVREAGFLLVDWGAVTPEGYHSDLTRVVDTHRTSAVSGADRDRLARIHALVNKAREAALACVRPGAVCQEVDRAARAVIEEAGHGEHFGHGLGHGIGLQIHEEPAVRMRSETVLAPGMVFTIEPGVYLPGWGGVRIEDDVLVTPDGCEVLTSVPRGLDELALRG
jgi:Xaa-Pro aminopeptidase